MQGRALASGLVMVAAALCLTPVTSGAVTFDWVMVRSPFNAADTTGLGSVAKTFRISKYEVTNSQYAEFLNATAKDDPNGLYHASMGSGYGGITRSGSAPTFTYSVIAGRGNMPVNFVSFYNSLRFANWLYNGQPTGAQGSSTTEDGAYTFSGPTTVGARNAGAQIFLPSENEWYKAAYYKASTASYFVYPTSSNAIPTCALPGATPNTANCNSVVSDLTPVGSYTGSASPMGTFDQGGNVWEWNEGTAGPSARSLRAGGFADPVNRLAPLESTGALEALATFDVGFRVASISLNPVIVPSLSPIGMTVLWSLLGLAGLRRLRR